MGIASLVATAVGVLLLVITAYVLAGGTLAVADVVATAQRDAAGAQEARLRTSIGVIDCAADMPNSTLYAEIENNGSEIIKEFEYVDVFLLQDGEIERYAYGSGTETWSVNSITPDSIHPSQLDPGEVMNISIRYSGSPPTWIQVTTPYGVSASSYTEVM